VGEELRPKADGLPIERPGQGDQRRAELVIGELREGDVLFDVMCRHRHVVSFGEAAAHDHWGIVHGGIFLSHRKGVFRGGPVAVPECRDIVEVDDGHKERQAEHEPRGSGEIPGDDETPAERDSGHGSKAVALLEHVDGGCHANYPEKQNRNESN
jgi:hypothetical protein